MMLRAVMATDVDSVTNSQLTYSVSDANFTVQTLNNIGYIRTAQSVTHSLTHPQPHSLTYSPCHYVRYGNIRSYAKYLESTTYKINSTTLNQKRKRGCPTNLGTATHWR